MNLSGGEAMSITATHVANYLIKKSLKENKHFLDLLRINKMTYLCFGWASAITGEYLFKDRIEAWRLGPVIPNLYHQFKHYGVRFIEEPSKEINFATLETYVDTVDKKEVGKEIIKIIDKVWATYKGLRASTLIELTHTKGTPWSQVYESYDKGTEIKKESIKAFYKEFIDKK